MKRHSWLIRTRTGLEETPAEQTLGFDVDQGPAEESAFNFPLKKAIPTGFYLKPCR